MARVSRSLCRGRSHGRGRRLSGTRALFKRTRSSLKRRRPSPSRSATPERSEVVCGICLEAQADELTATGCNAQHAFCQTCLRCHIRSSLTPKCPWPGCQYELQEADVQRICGVGSELRRLRRAQLDRALQLLPGARTCPNELCRNVVIVDGDRSKDRQPVTCPCGIEPWCSRCKQPYHFAVECEEVQRLRLEWHEWVARGRQKWHRRETKHAKEEDRIRDALEQAIERHAELEADEAWKGARCRLCPHCGSIVEKLEGCNAMRCGVDADAGDNQQKGCGQRFQWDLAERYTPVVSPAPVGDSVVSSIAGPRGKHTRHPYYKCDLCFKDIVGPRFRCIHCRAFNVCVACDRDALHDRHPWTHVFQIYFEAEDPDL